VARFLTVDPVEFVVDLHVLLLRLDGRGDVAPVGAGLAESDQERRGYLRLAAQGRITDAELDKALAELQETRETAEQELEAHSSRQVEVEALERDRDALLASWSEAVPAELDNLNSEEKNELYHTLRLELTPREGGYEVTGPFCTSEPLSFSRWRTTAPAPPRRLSSSAAFPRR
jgi:hypothetical protein